MNKKRRIRYRELLLDPTLGVTSDERVELSPAQARQLTEHQILDKNLEQTFTELTAREQPAISSEESFRLSLLERLSKETSATTTREQSRFFSRLKRREFLTRLHETFFYSRLAPLSWAPVLVVFLFIPAALLFYRESIGMMSPNLQELSIQGEAPTAKDLASRGPGKPTSEKPVNGGKADDRKGTPAGKLAANLPPREGTQEKQPPAREVEPERFTGKEEMEIARSEARDQIAPVSGMTDESSGKKGAAPAPELKKEKSVAARTVDSEKTASITRAKKRAFKEAPSTTTRRELRNQEKELKRSLNRVRTQKEKIAILKKLEKIYQKLGWPNKLKKTRVQLKRLLK